MALFTGWLIKSFSFVLITFLGSSAILFSRDYFNNTITKFDKALINYLKGGGKIKFKVTSSDADLSQIPQFSDSNPISINIRVSVSSSGTTTGELEDPTPPKEAAKREELAKLNGGENPQEWTWSCEIKLTRPEGVKDVNDLHTEIKNELKQTGNDPNGYFDKLTKKDGEKDLKIQLIRECALTRGYLVNRAINKKEDIKTADDYSIKTANTLESTKEFQLVKRSSDKGGKDALFFGDMEYYRYWFGVSSYRAK